MWDCKHRTPDDSCKRRKAICYPGGKKCVLEGKYELPFRTEPDPLAQPVKESLKQSKSRKQRRQKGNV